MSTPGDQPTGGDQRSPGRRRAASPPGRSLPPRVRPEGTRRRTGGGSRSKPVGTGQGRAVRPEPQLSSEWLAELAATAPHRQERVTELVSRGLEAFMNGDYEASVGLARQAKDRAPRSARVRELLGLAAYRAGRWKEALGELLAYRRLTGQVDENHVIADCYRAQGRPERALEVCDEVSRHQVPPELWAEVVIVAASALADRGLLVEALARLSRADLEPRQVNPYHLRLWYVQADLLDRVGRREEARAVWERIAAEEPNFFDTEERLADAEKGERG